MKYEIALIAAAAAVFAAAPAAAGESRLEARGGIAWSAGQEEAIVGVALGHDFDLGEDGGGFFGIETSIDKVLQGGTTLVFGATARGGIRVSDAGKAYVNGGYSFGEGEDAWHAGGGYQHRVSGAFYIKAEYRHFFFGNGFDDADAVALGVGAEF